MHAMRFLAATPLVAALALQASAPSPQARPEKAVRGSVELVPNYLMHLLVVCDVWHDRGMGDPEYRKAHQATVQAADRELVHRSRALLAWGNGQAGPLASLFFFRPARTDRIDSREALGRYLDAQGRAFESPEGLRAFNRAYPELAFSEGEAEGIRRQREADPKGFAGLQAAHADLTAAVLRNFEAYERDVWPAERARLEQGLAALRRSFGGRRAIERWEAFLGTPFPGGAFTIVLTGANRHAPTANDLSPVRYNFWYQPGHEAELARLVLHEVGTNLLAAPRERLEGDAELGARIGAAGLRPQGVVWRAFESLAEFYLEKIGGHPRAAWSGSAFDGQPYDFPVFFAAYDAAYARDPKLGAERMMREGVAAFLKARGAAR